MSAVVIHLRVDVATAAAALDALHSEVDSLAEEMRDG